MEAPLEVAFKADPEKEEEEKAAAEPMVATRAAIESFILTVNTIEFVDL